MNFIKGKSQSYDIYNKENSICRVTINTTILTKTRLPPLKCLHQQHVEIIWALASKKHYWLSNPNQEGRMRLMQITITSDNQTQRTAQLKRAVLSCCVSLEDHRHSSFFMHMKN